MRLPFLPLETLNTSIWIQAFTNGSINNVLRLA